MTRKRQTPVKVRASVRVRHSTVRDAIGDDIEAAIRCAIRRTWKHRDDPQPTPEVVDALVSEVSRGVDGVMDVWLDFGECDCGLSCDLHAGRELRRGEP